MTEDIFEPEQVSSGETNPEINKTEQPPSGSVTEEQYTKYWDELSITDNTNNINEDFNGETEQFAKPAPKTNAKIAKQEDNRWPETDDWESETTELSVDSQNDYYKLIKQCLFWIDVNLVDDKKFPEELVDEWFIQAPSLKLEESQKKLNKGLLSSIIKDFNLGGYKPFANLKKFLENSKNNKDLKAVLNLKRGKLDVTLLHVLIEHKEATYALLKAGADPNIQDNRGKTPLHDTVIYNCDHYEAANCLLRGGANPNIKDNEGKTPLHHYATYYGEVTKETADLLISKGADYTIPDNNGKIPLQIAIDNSNYDVMECFFTEKQKKLNEELYKMIEGTSISENDWYKYSAQDIENLKRFLDKHKNNEDLKMILNIKDSEGNSKVLRDGMYTQVVDLLLAAGATESQVMEAEQEAEVPYVPYQCLLDSSPYQLTKLNGLLSKVLKAGNMAELQKVVDEAIESGVRLNFAKNEDNYFTDYVLKRINQLRESYEVASNILCTLILKGAKLKDQDSSKVIDKMELEFKDHKANMIKAHEKYVNYSQKFLKIAEGAASGKLNDAKMDNSTFYLEYSENSKIDVAKITDGARDLGLTQGEIEYGRDIIKIGKSEVEIITAKGIRHYTDLADNSNIVLTFYTSLGELEVNLSPDKKDKDKIIVEVSNKKEILEKFKDCKEELGKNCSLGGYLVYNAIEQGYFERSGKLMRSEAMSQSNGKIGPLTKLDEIRGALSFKETVSRCI